MARLLDDACQLGFARPKTTSTFQWIVHRMLMHIGEPHVEHITDAHLIECREVLHRFAERPDVDVLYGSVQQYHKQLKDYMTYLHHLRVVLYQRGQVRSEPQRQVDRSSRRVFVVHKPYLQKTIARYLTARRVTDQPSTIKNLDLALRQFVIWIEQTYPNIDTFAQVTREQVLEYAEMLDTRLGVVTRRPLASSSKMCISPVQSL